jgi:hypothetical protein
VEEWGDGDVHNHMLYTGNLVTVLPPLAHEADHTHTMSVCCLTEGTFGIRARLTEEREGNDSGYYSFVFHAVRQ